MEQFLIGVMLAALIVGGVYMIIWPAAVVQQNRDEDEKSCPPSGLEIWQMRVLGVLVIAGVIYMVYAILTGMPGAEFTGV
jgi:hypothetical protein